jgi:hypothetical protein
MVNHGYAIPDAEHKPPSPPHASMAMRANVQTRSQLLLDQMGFRILKDHSEGADGYNLETRKCGNHDNEKGGKSQHGSKEVTTKA